MERNVLVAGGGIGGIVASLSLAESGFRVYLVDRSQYIGGMLLQHDRWFPDNRCQMCQVLPVFSRDACSQVCLRHNFSHPDIEMIPGAGITEVRGEAGNFEVALNVMSRWVNPDRCTGCGLCAEVCPVEIPDEFNEGLRKRKSVYSRSPLSIPPVYSIDRDNCNRCGKCVTACPAGAIDLNMPDETRKLAVGAIIIAGGSQSIDAGRLGQYGFGRYPNVITGRQMERMLAPEGKLLRPSDGKTPQRVAFLQCIGSRDKERDYCSAICCMAALKEAVLIKERNPDTKVEIFYMDIRDSGKGYHRYYRKVRDAGTEFTACRVPAVRESPKTRNITVLAQGEDGKPVSREFDLVVLSVGQCASPGTVELSRILGVEVNRWGYVRGQDFWQVRTAREGIYVCGSAIAPADISETVTQANAAACRASILLSSARSRLAGKKVESPDSGDARIAVFICRCGEEIASAVDTREVADFARTLPGVVSVVDGDYLCLPETLEKVKQTITESGVNRVLFAACASYHYQRLFEKAVREAGIAPSLWQIVNLREQVARVHKDNLALATDKARTLMAMAVEQLRGQELLPLPSSPVSRRGLVIGGGVSGLVSALCLAEQGFEVSVVEKSPGLGGHAGVLHYCSGNKNPQAFIHDIMEKVKANSRIQVFLEAEVIGTTGYAGNFKTKVMTADGTVTTLEHGAVIIATGAQDYQPTEYLYGGDERIITGKELQRRLAEGSLGTPNSIVMIQCVGSRDEQHPYCSQSCCSKAIATSLKIKEQNPQTQVVILYRDMMTRGFSEEYYTQARSAGVLFVRYQPENKPEISLEGGVLTVQVDDPVLREKLEIAADLLVLSTGVLAADNRKLAETFGLELDEDMFFKEASKFRPVDTVKDGVFICGRANAPVNIEEEVVQAQAAAQRAASILARERLESGWAISEVNERRCRGCGLCVTACPYSARVLDEERRVAVVREALCRGCGACASVCPSGATTLRGMKDKQVFAMLDAAFRGNQGGR